jgi:deoxyribose-phosphate aldolase
MNDKISNLEKYIEHTILKPEATAEEVEKILDEAVDNGFLGVCINPVYVKMAKDYLKDSDVKVVTVIGFPLGAHLTAVKEFEAKKAAEDGADELDMVINIGALKEQNYELVEKDINAVVKAADGKPVKVIIETDLLTKEEIVKACELSVKAGAAFVKTSTGFVKGGVGATAEDVKLMYDTVSHHGLQVKASGGVRDMESTIQMIKAGASRIGTSSGVKITKG